MPLAPYPPPPRTYRNAALARSAICLSSCWVTFFRDDTLESAEPLEYPDGSAAATESTHNTING